MNKVERLHDDSAARAIVGAGLISGLPAVEEALQAGFEAKKCRDGRIAAIARAQLRLAITNQPIDVLTVKNALQESGELEKVGFEFLAGLGTEAFPALNIPAYVAQVDREYRDRNLLSKANNYLTAAIANNGTQELAITELQIALQEHSKIGKRFTIGTGAEALKPQRDINWLIREFLARSWVSIWFGEPGCKKTWGVLDQAVCVALGKPWLGFRTVKSTVLIIDEESGTHRLLSRMGNVMRAHEAPAEIPLYFVSLHGFNLIDDHGAAELEDLVKEVQPGLVIIDALADVMLGGDENLVRDIQPPLVRLRRIAERQDCAIQVIHHVNKAGEYRGSTALKGAVDSMILVESAPDSNLVSFRAEKARDVMIKPFAATAHFDIGTFRLTEADIQTGQAKLSPGERYVLKYLEANGPATVKAIIESADVCSPATARRALYSLADRDRIKRVDNNGTGKGHEAIYASVRTN
jgi:hypothetical protein